MSDAADISIVIRKGRTFTTDYQLKTEVITDGVKSSVPRDVTGATFVMQFRATRGGATSDLTPVFAEIDLAQGQFSFTASDTLTGAMVTTAGFWEIVMTLSGAVTTEFEGAYGVILPVVQP